MNTAAIYDTLWMDDRATDYVTAVMPCTALPYIELSRNRTCYIVNVKLRKVTFKQHSPTGWSLKNLQSLSNPSRTVDLSMTEVPDVCKGSLLTSATCSSSHTMPAGPDVGCSHGVGCGLHCSVTTERHTSTCRSPVGALSSGVSILPGPASSDTIPRERSGVGCTGHWIVIAMDNGEIEVFDSLGETDSSTYGTEMKNFTDKHNCTWINDSMLERKNCAFYSLMFVHHKSRGLSGPNAVNMLKNTKSIKETCMSVYVSI